MDSKAIGLKMLIYIGSLRRQVIKNSEVGIHKSLVFILL